jgi:hypothetical protein
MARRRLLSTCLVLLLAVLAGSPVEPPADDYARVRRAFERPPAEFRSVPLWVWNDRMTRVEISSQLREFKERGIGGVFIHPRPGLITPYLSPEWLDLWRFAVRTGKGLGLKVWIYDENSYPSGFAGGHVPALMPDAVRSGLRMRTMETLPGTLETEPLVILEHRGRSFVPVSAAEARRRGAGEYRVFDVVRASPSPWHGGFAYVDIMRPEVTRKFLEVTLDAYKKAFGAEFGGTVPGSFEDEAEIAPPGGADMVNYTPALFDAFRSKWGYNLGPDLPSLFEETGEWRRVRHDYYATLLDLFIKGWLVPYGDYCRRNGLVFTGHYWEHEWPRPRVSPDNLALAAYTHMPGIDILMNAYQTDHGAQFGNARSVREIRSAANQLGLKRTLSETYGAGGWDLDFLDQKRIADWEFALGVNFIDQHLSYVTIKGARKRDHPQSFSYHEPWWKAYGLMGDYFGRLSAALSAGRQPNRVVVLEPTTSAWMYYSPAGSSPRFEEIGRDFQDFVNTLEANQAEYDLVSEDTLRNHGTAEKGRLRVGRAVYDLVVLPPGLDSVDRATRALLESYLALGGRVLSFVPPPQYIDGRTDPALGLDALSYKDRWVTTSVAAAGPALAGFGLQDVVFSGPVREPNMLFHMHRKLADADLVFICNTSASDSASGRFDGPGRSAERWDALTGLVSGYPSASADKGQSVEFDLPPGGSLLLCLRDEAVAAATPAGGKSAAPEGAEVLAASGLRVQPLGPNVMTLDYCDLKLDGREDKDLYFYEAQTRVFKRYGFERDPWDNAVQYKSAILDRNTFGPGTGFEAVYRFDVAPGVSTAGLEAVVEQPELFEVSINGRPVAALKGRWWLDRAFGVYPIGPGVEPGPNSLKVKASPFTVFSELEPVYILGDFRLESQDKGFRIVPPAPAGLGSWKAQGRPFYAAGMSYEKRFDIPALDPVRERLVLRLGEWRGSVSEVLVDGRSAGTVAFPPYELDLTSRLAPGPHTVSVVVYGTLKNTLGPHHADPPRGMAWPGSFQKGAPGGHPPGAKYDVFDYGLMTDFRLIRTR